MEIATFLNNHFSNVGQSVQDNFATDANLDDIAFPCSPPVLEFYEVALNDVSSAINRLKSTQSSSTDGITANILKTCKVEIIELIFN